jgi:hypothetical protein
MKSFLWTLVQKNSQQGENGNAAKQCASSISSDDRPAKGKITVSLAAGHVVVARNSLSAILASSANDCTRILRIIFRR